MTKVMVNGVEHSFPPSMSQDDIKKVLQQKYGIAEDPKVEAPKEPEELESWYDDPMMASRMLLDGLSLGWADEVGSHMAAGLVHILNPELTEGKTYSQVYDEIHGSVKQEEEAYRTANPVASTLLNVAGGIAMPVGGATTLAGKTAVGAGMGAVYGAGAADTDQRLEGAATGAAFGGGATLALNAIGKAGSGIWNSVAKKRIAEPLQKADGSFTPITLAKTEEGQGDIVQALYKDVFGATLIGGTKFRAAEQAVIERSRNAQMIAEASLDMAKKNADDAVASLKSGKWLQNENIKEKFRELSTTVREGKTGAKEAYNTAVQAIKNTALRDATAAVDESVNSQVQAWRRTVLSNALPSMASKGQIKAALSTNDMHVAEKLISNAWKENGFKMLHDHSFRFDTDSVVSKLTETVKRKDGKIWNRSEINRIAQETIDNLIDGKKSGWLKGDVLANIRSSLGGKASSIGESTEAKIRSSVLKEMKSILDDDIIVPGLQKLKNGDKLVKNFMGDKDAWGAVVSLRKAVDSATEVGKQGAFDPNDWINAIKSNANILSRRGEGKFQREAYKVGTAMKQRDALIKSAARQAAKGTINAAKTDLKRKQAEVNKRLAQLQREQALERKGLETDTLARQAQIKASQEINDLTMEAKILKDQVARMEGASASGKGSVNVFKQLAATGALSAIAGVSGAGMVAGVPAGMMLGRLATSQTGQKLFAGQTAFQAGMRSVAEKAAQMPTVTPNIGATVGGTASNVQYGIPQNPMETLQ